MKRDRVELLTGILAVCVLAVLVVSDLVVPAQYGKLTTLFVLAPLIACALAPVRDTVAVGLLAVAAALASGWWNHAAASPQQFIQVLTVVLVSAAAVAVSAVRIRREEQMARLSRIAEIAQRAILPVLPARVGGVQIAARYTSAGRDAMVGGDLFDCYHSRDHIRLLVGDVRGKGIGGVEQAARVIRAFRQSAALQETLVQVAEEMDAYVADFFEPEEFATALLVEVRPEQSGPQGTAYVLRLVSCGHPGPQLVGPHGSRVLELPAGPPLGLGLGLPSDFSAVDITWSPGDRMLMYTDGLSEARDAHGRFLPMDRLDEAIRSGTVEQAIDSVLATVRRHVRHGELDDDLAAVLLENQPRPAATEGDREPASARR